MKYIITEIFGPGIEGWDKYAQWAGLESCEEYYSIDGKMRKGLFSPKSAEDWKNCVNEDFQTDFITNLDYARKIVETFNNAEVIGVVKDPRSLDEYIPPNHVLMGYDIIDGDGIYSLLTNWGGREENKGILINKSALIDDRDFAYQLRERLHNECSEDHHAAECEVWAVYKINV